MTNLIGIAFQQLIIDKYIPVDGIAHSDVQMSVDEIFDLIQQYANDEYAGKEVLIPLLITNGYKNYNAGGAILWMFKLRNPKPNIYILEGVL